MDTRLAFMTLLCYVTTVRCYPYGPPPDACVTLTPQHPTIPAGGIVTPQTSDPSTNDPSYTLTVTDQAGSDVLQYSPGDVLTLTLTSTGMFRGFLLKAQRADSTLNQAEGVGTFTNPDSSKMNLMCQNGAVTQNQAGRDAGFNGPIEFTWTAPTPAQGHVEFLVTIVETQTVFWTQIAPNNLRQPQPDGRVYLKDPTAPDLSDGPPIDENAGDPLKLSDCDKSDRGCYTRPNKCSSNCDLAVMWQQLPGNTWRFEMSTKSDWVALGFSSDKTMGDDTVIECIWNKDADQAWGGNSKNTGQSNSPDALYSAGISDQVNGRADGETRCRFTHSNVPSEAFYLLLGGGSTTGRTKLQHADTPFISSKMVQLTDFEFVEGELAKPLLIKIHGALMLVAWVMFASLGILMARYYKDSWASSKLCAQKVWFAIHRFLMVSVFLLTIGGVVVIFVHVEGWSDLETADPKILRAHPYLGIIVAALAIINPIMAIFRPHPGESSRVYFNWAHWGVGTLAHTVSMFAVFLGLRLPSSAGVAPDWLLWVMVAFVAFHILCDIVLEIHKCTANKNKGSNTMEMQQMGEGAKSESRGDSFRLAVLGIYFVVVLGLGLTLVVTIAIQ